MAAKVMSANGQPLPDRSAAGRERARQPRNTGKRRVQPEPWAGFKTGFLTGAFVSLSAGFILLGAWFHSEQGGPYRSMIGREPVGIGVSNGAGPGAAVGVDNGPSDTGKARARRLSIPMWTPTGPDRMRVIDDGTDPDAEARTTVDQPTQSGEDEHQASGELARDTDETTSGADSPKPANPQTRRRPASRIPSPRTVNRSAGNRLTGRGEESSPRNGMSPRRVQDGQQDLGIDELMKAQQHNRKTIGQATDLLRALGGN